MPSEAIQACTDKDEEILTDLPESDRAAMELCLDCMARIHLKGVLCFVQCTGDACEPYGLGACEECRTPALSEFCDRGGVPAERMDMH